MMKRFNNTAISWNAIALGAPRRWHPAGRKPPPPAWASRSVRGAFAMIHGLGACLPDRSTCSYAEFSSKWRSRPATGYSSSR